MIIINQKIYVNLRIDGNDIPNAPNLVQRITMTEGMGALSPALELVLNDYSGVINRELALTDANQLEVTVGRSPEDKNTQKRTYRLFGTKQTTTATGPAVRAFGIYDAPRYLTNAARESYEANSSDVIAAIAAKCGLHFKTLGGAPPQDKQIWLNATRSRAQFVHDVARHGRINDSSVMGYALTSLGELRYMNLGELIETPKDKVLHMFVHNTTSKPANVTQYKVREAKDYSSAGLMNAWQNYGSTRVAHSLDGMQEVFDKIAISTTAGFLAINQQVAKTVQKTRIDYSALDCGNNHDNYWKAYYQNLRLLALFSEHVSILTTEVTEVQLYDPVIYKQANADPKEPVNKSDIYIVIGKTLLVKGGANYGERLELVRRSLTVKGETSLAGEDIGGGNAAASNPVPDSLINPTVTPASSSRPQMAQITQSQKAVESKMTQVKTQLPDHTNSVEMATPSIRNLSNGLKNKVPTSELISQMGTVRNSMSHYNTQATALNSSYAAAASPLESMNNQLQSLGAGSAVRQAVLTQPAGVLNSMAVSMQAVSQQKSVAGTLKAVRNLIKTTRAVDLKATLDGQRALAALEQDTQNAEMRAKESTMTQARMWNNSVSTVLGKPIPTVIPVPNVHSLNAIQSDMYTPQSDGKPRTLDQQTNTLTKTLTNTRTPQWVPEEAPTVIPAADIDKALNELEADIKAGRRREQDMYPTTWDTANA